MMTDTLIHLMIQDAIEEKKQVKFEYQPFIPSLEEIESYLQNFAIFLFQNHKAYFLELINIPKDNQGDTILKDLRSCLFQKFFEFEKDKETIISHSIFKEFEKNESSLDFYHKKMIFESFCESLEYFKPFDIRGKNLDWKLNEKKLTFQTIDDDNIQIVFDQAINKVLEYSSYFGGFINEPREYAPPIVDVMFLPQLQQEKLERMVQDEIYEQNETWNDYHKYETVVQMELSEQIFEDLVSDTISDLLKSNKQNKYNHE